MTIDFAALIYAYPLRWTEIITMPWIKKTASEIEESRIKTRKQKKKHDTFMNIYIFILWSVIFGLLTFKDGYDHSELVWNISMVFIFTGIMIFGRWLFRKVITNRFNNLIVGSFSAYTAQARRLTLGAGWTGDIDLFKRKENMICICCESVLPLTKEMKCIHCGATCEDSANWKWVEQNEVQPVGGDQ